MVGNGKPLGDGATSPNGSFRGRLMKHWLIAIALLLAAWDMPGVGQAPAQAQPNLRAMKMRARTVTLRKNRYVGHVLDENGISYRLDEHGIITRVNLDGEWQAVERIDVVPMTRFFRGLTEVVGHEVYIFTPTQTIRLYSNRVAR
ncbi:MAG: hypothetical protein JRF59_07295 [Deltaproteobacteria bacterium]|nr:hypothetical protein [Deltaproteobacteria bacterium]MBW2101270.1 hypothetical protein [Deltaproteobacteria bacterium]MBW2347630.1 hypothetical protein [Deltaproteobacteria bacterium]